MADLAYVPLLDKKLVELDEAPKISVSAGWVGGVNVVLEQKEMAGTLVETYDKKLTDIFDSLEKILVADPVPDDWKSLLDDIVINNIPSFDVGNIPTPGNITLPDFNNLTFPTLGTLKEVPAIDTNFAFPDAPATVDPILEHNLEAYTSDMWIGLLAKVNGWIVTGGTGLSEGEQTARHALNSARQLKTNEKAYLVSKATLNSKALSFPSFVMTNLENQMATEVLRQEATSSNEILIADGELTQKNNHFAVEQGIALEQILRNFWQIKEQLTFDVKRGTVEFILKKFSENNQAYIAQTQAINTKMQANVSAAEAIIASNQPIIDKFKIEMDGVLNKGSLIAKERDSIVNVSSIEADVYKTRVSAAANYYDALTENQKAQIQKSTLKLDKAKTELDYLLKTQVELSTQRAEILANLGKMFTQITSAALNTVSTAVNHTTNNAASVSTRFASNKSNSETYHHNQSGSETRSIQQEGPDIT